VVFTKEQLLKTEIEKNTRRMDRRRQKSTVKSIRCMFYYIWAAFL